VITIDDVVIPIASPQLQGVSTLKAEGAFPGTWLGIRILAVGEWELRLVIIPRTEEMNGFDVGRSADSERQLDCRGRGHVDLWGFL